MRAAARVRPPDERHAHRGRGVAVVVGAVCGRAEAPQRVQQVRQPVAVRRGHEERPDVGVARGDFAVGARHVAAVLALVERDDARHVARAAPQPAADGVVVARRADGAVEEQERDVGATDALRGPRAHRGRQARVRAALPVDLDAVALDARRVDDLEPERPEARGRRRRVARRPRDRRGDARGRRGRAPPPRAAARDVAQRVEQRRLAHVGPAHDGDAQGHVPCWTCGPLAAPSRKRTLLEISRLFSHLPNT